VGYWVVDHGVVELLGADELDVGRDAVGRAEVERLLRLPARDTHQSRTQRRAHNASANAQTAQPRPLRTTASPAPGSARAHADFKLG
jgi:hypothetical protein